MKPTLSVKDAPYKNGDRFYGVGLLGGFSEHIVHAVKGKEVCVSDICGGAHHWIDPEKFPWSRTADDAWTRFAESCEQESKSLKRRANEYAGYAAHARLQIGSVKNGL